MTTAEPIAPAHPSAFDFDLAILGEPTTPFRAHLEGCTDCRGRLELLMREQQQFAASPVPERSARHIEQRIVEARRSRWRRFWPGPAAIFLTAVSLAFVILRTSNDDATRLKGTAQVEAFVKSGDAAPRRLAAGERLGKSDRVQLAYKTSGFTRLSLFVIEHGCEASPAGTWTVDQSEGVLPTSWALAGEGGGRLYLAFADAPVTLDAFVAALRSTPQGCESDRTPDVQASGFVARGVAILPGAQR